MTKQDFARWWRIAGIALFGIVAANVAMAAHSALPWQVGSDTQAKSPPVPLIMMTDLFRPHDDPDDHWDLATAYALAAGRHIDLLAVVIDFPRPDSKRDPDVGAVAQLNYLTGLAVPVIVGSPHPYGEADALQGDKLTQRRFASLFRILEASEEPVVISVAGSCRDMATAIRLRPELFASKCAAIYVNAGSSARPEDGSPLEWNVQLDQAAFNAVFAAPCPVYWMPCFEDVRRREVGEYCTYYRFRQSEMLPRLAPGLRKFFAWVFEPLGSERNQGSNWLRYLLAEENKELLTTIGSQGRSMWCTAGFFHLAGLQVDSEGQIFPSGAAVNPGYEFLPIKASPRKDGHVDWQCCQTQSHRLIFHVKDTVRYQNAMTKALGDLLSCLP